MTAAVATRWAGPGPTPVRAGLLLLALLAGCGGNPAPIRGEKRDELCQSLRQAPTFRCPSGTSRRGKPPPDGAEMWCQRWDGTRHGSYRRYAPGAPSGAAAPDFVTDGTVIGEYRDGAQHGAWWTHRQGAREVHVAYYEAGALRQRVHCRP